MYVKLLAHYVQRLQTTLIVRYLYDICVQPRVADDPFGINILTSITILISDV